MTMLLDGLDPIASGGLQIAYRASRAPQVLRVEVRTAGRSSKRAGPMILKRLIELVNAGAAGGAQFAPSDGKAERLSGPWDGPDAFGPEYMWVLRVSSVAPRFLRTMVEQLRRCGWEQPVESIKIIGELTGGVDTKQMTQWLSDPDAYVEEWPSVPFTVTQAPAEKARFGITFDVAPPDDVLKLLAVRWVMATAAYVGDDGRWDGAPTPLPAFEIIDRHFVASYDHFQHRAAPARAVLVNMLARIAQAYPVEALHIDLPGFAQASSALEPIGSAQSKSAQTKSAQTKSAQSKPAQTQPAWTKPAQAKLPKPKSTKKKAVTKKAKKR